MDSLTAEVGSLRKRMEQLERQNRWMKGIGIICLLLAIILFTAVSTRAQTTTGTITANKFILVDEGGNSRGVLALAGGEPGLDLYDEKGKLRGSFTLSIDGDPKLYICDEQETMRGVFGIANGEPGLGLYNQQGKPGGSFNLNGGAGIVLYDPQGKMGSIWGFDDNGKPCILFYDQLEKPMWKAP